MRAIHCVDPLCTQFENENGAKMQADEQCRLYVVEIVCGGVFCLLRPQITVSVFRVRNIMMFADEHFNISIWSERRHII